MELTLLPLPDFPEITFRCITQDMDHTYLVQLLTSFYEGSLYKPNVKVIHEIIQQFLPNDLCFNFLVYWENHPLFLACLEWALQSPLWEEYAANKGDMGLSIYYLAKDKQCLNAGLSVFIYALFQTETIKRVVVPIYNSTLKKQLSLLLKNLGFCIENIAKADPVIFSCRKAQFCLTR